MFKTATLPTPRSGRFETETSHTLLRQSVSKPTGECSANYSHEAYITAIRRSDDINNIESEGRYCFAAAVMPRRTDAINSIESEGRYDERIPACDRTFADSRTAHKNNEHPQEDTALTLCPLVISGPTHRKTTT